MQPLLTPVRMGKLQLRNRIIMAPMTRMRAANPGYVPTELHAEYYRQRASAGLIIGEGTEISLDAYGWADSPGRKRPGGKNRFARAGARPKHSNRPDDNHPTDRPLVSARGSRSNRK
jgi:NADH:flavin oxidoreductase / NADH oxidase family